MPWYAWLLGPPMGVAGFLVTWPKFWTWLGHLDWSMGPTRREVADMQLTALMAPIYRYQTPGGGPWRRVEAQPARLGGPTHRCEYCGDPTDPHSLDALCEPCGERLTAIAAGTHLAGKWLEYGTDKKVGEWQRLAKKHGYYL